MRKPACLLLRSIARLHSTIKSSRTHLGQCLAQPRAAVAAVIQRGTTQPSEGVEYGPIFDFLDAELTAVQFGLSTTETVYACRQYSLAQARHARDQAAADLRERHAPLQRLLGANPRLGGADIVTETPTAPWQLAQQTGITLRFLKDFERWPPAPVHGVTLDAGALAHDLEADLGKLETQLTAVNAEAAGVDHARSRADVAFAQADRVLSWVARTLDSLSGLAGDERLAGRIRRHCG